MNDATPAPQPATAAAQLNAALLARHALAAAGLHPGILALADLVELRHRRAYPARWVGVPPVAPAPQKEHHA